MFQIDNRIFYIILAVLIIFSLGSYLQNPTNLMNLVLTIPAVLIAITFHEFAHAFAADKLGDDTPKRQGRLTLNPLAHLDPIGSILLLFARFGWGKPVEINTRNFTRKISQSAGEAIVSIAGPLMNILIAFVFSMIYCAILKFAPYNFLVSNVGTVIRSLVSITAIINVGLGVFNLIPLPPLDGSKILRHFLPYSAKEWLDRNGYIFYIIFIAIWITGIAGYIISPVIDWVMNGILWLCAQIFGIGILF